MSKKKKTRLNFKRIGLMGAIIDVLVFIILLTTSNLSMLDLYLKFRVLMFLIHFGFVYLKSLFLTFKTCLTLLFKVFKLKDEFIDDDDESSTILHSSFKFTTSSLFLMFECMVLTLLNVFAVSMLISPSKDLTDYTLMIVYMLNLIAFTLSIDRIENKYRLVTRNYSKELLSN